MTLYSPTDRVPLGKTEKSVMIVLPDHPRGRCRLIGSSGFTVVFPRLLNFHRDLGVLCRFVPLRMILFSKFSLSLRGLHYLFYSSYVMGSIVLSPFSLNFLFMLVKCGST